MWAMHFRFFCEALALLLVGTWTQPALASLCEMGTLKEACASTNPERSALCKQVRQSADDDDFTFVHLGGSYFLYAGVGFYLINTETGVKASVSFRVDPTLAGAKKGSNDRCLIADYRSLLTHGKFSDKGTVLMVRTNPITGTPYLLDLGLGGLPLQEARALMCSAPKYQRSIRLCSNPRSFDTAWNASAQPYTSAAAMLKADKTALSPAGKQNSPHMPYEKAGILSILDEKPQDLRPGQYVLMLNNYALFATKTDRVELAVEILDKVLRLSPERVPATLNMADAIDALVGRRDETMPLGEASLAKLRSASAAYRQQYQQRK
jgi:hypothetical protein